MNNACLVLLLSFFAVAFCGALHSEEPTGPLRASTDVQNARVEDKYVVLPISLLLRETGMRMVKLPTHKYLGSAKMLATREVSKNADDLGEETLLDHWPPDLGLTDARFKLLFCDDADSPVRRSHELLVLPARICSLQELKTFRGTNVTLTILVDSLSPEALAKATNAKGVSEALQRQELTVSFNSDRLLEVLE